MNANRPKTKWKRRFLVIFLAVFCIGGAELVACYFFAPALYEQLTEPVRSRFRAAKSAVSDVLDGVQQRLSDVGEPEEFQTQIADEDPAIVSTQPIEDPKVTQLVWQNEGNYLTGGSIDIRYYQQNAPPWTDKKYGRDLIGPYGCGPTAMAMAVSSMTDQIVDPEQMSKWAYDSGYWVSRSGSRLSLIEGTAAAYGLIAEPLTDRRPEVLLRELASGKVAVALMTTGHFTKSGHFILLRGATLNGTILVADPSSLERSLTAWDPQLIIDELSPSRDAGAPLWLLVPPAQ